MWILTCLFSPEQNREPQMPRPAASFRPQSAFSRRSRARRTFVLRGLLQEILHMTVGLARQNRLQLAGTGRRSWISSGSLSSALKVLQLIESGLANDQELLYPRSAGDGLWLPLRNVFTAPFRSVLGWITGDCSLANYKKVMITLHLLLFFLNLFFIFLFLSSEQCPPHPHHTHTFLCFKHW